MTTINANGARLTPAILDEALKGSPRPPRSAKAHPHLVMGWRNEALHLTSVFSRPAPTEFALPRKPIVTIAGIPVTEDDSMPRGHIEFRDEKNELVAVIDNIALPLFAYV